MSSVGKQPPGITGDRVPSLCGSGLSIGGNWELENLTPVTCCTICRKLAGSAVMKVVRVRLEARDLRLETLGEEETGMGLR